MSQHTTLAPHRVSDPVLGTQDLLHHWQQHRALTRRVIEAFPEKEFFEFSIGGMRSFAKLCFEMMGIAAPGVVGLATGKWTTDEFPDFFVPDNEPTTKAEVLEYWDRITVHIDKWLPQVSAERFRETDVAFGQYEGTIYWTLLYFMDNDVHHRAQGYVYLRALGIEPPPFWDRQ